MINLNKKNMKKIILTALAVFALANGYSQEEGKFRVGLDLGYTVPSNGGGGILFSLEPKYNLKDNMNVGLRIGAAAMVRDISTDGGGTTSAKISANGSYVGTYDYYFNNSGSSFVPYIGGGAGYYSIANVEFDDVETSSNVGLDASGKMGGLIRGGFEWGKFRMGIEYNLVPKSELQDLSGTKLANVSNSYLGIHLGFYVGGGKWGK
jgi:outer membrane protein W